MGLNHDHFQKPAYNNAFLFGMVLNILFIIIEVIYGLQANSLALLADAGHNASDVLGLLVAWVATLLGTKKPSERYTYGYQSASIIAAILNAIFLLGAVSLIAWEAYQRFYTPIQPQGVTIMAVAAVGVVINGITAALFFKGQKHDLNIRGAYLHMAADAAISLGVVISGFILMQTGLSWIDPVISIGICIFIVIATWNMLEETIVLALHAVPKHINYQDVKAFLLQQQGVCNIHELHIWAMSTSEASLSVHLMMPDGHPGDSFLEELNKQLAEKYGICHTTIQIEISNRCDLEHSH